MGCVFCEIYEKEEFFYDDKYFFARFDKLPVSPGHAELIPKRHFASLFDLTKGESENWHHSLRNTIRCIKEINFKQLYREFIDSPLNDKSAEFCKKMLSHIGIEKKPDAYNIGVNEGEAAGRTINHLHIHIIPRFFGDVEDYVGGVRHIIPGMGNYKKGFL